MRVGKQESIFLFPKCCHSWVHFHALSPLWDFTIVQSLRSLWGKSQVCTGNEVFLRSEHAGQSHQGPWTAARRNAGWAPLLQVCLQGMFQYILYHLDTKHNMTETDQWNLEFIVRKIK